MFQPMLPFESQILATPTAPLAPEGVPASDMCPAGCDLLSWRQELKRLGGEPGSFDWLLDAAAGVSPARLHAVLLDPATTVPLKASLREIERLWRQHLCERVPLQYLVGQSFWRDFALEVGPAVLIPRPETEAMIDLAIDLLGDGGNGAPAELLWADLGTGSGCLAMGLARAFPSSHGLAVDISPAAVGQARRNLVRADLHTRVRLLQGDWFEAVKPWWGGLHLVLANPPYIPSEAVDGLDPVVRDHEPRLALDGGVDGLTCIRSLATDAPRALAAGGWLLLEHHHDQSQAVMDLFTWHGLAEVQSHADFEGHRRFVCGRLSPTSPPLNTRRRP